MDLPEDPLPCIHSTPHDLLLDGRPDEAASTLVGYMDSSWGDCLITRRSFGGCNMRLAGGPVGYKGQLLPTVALSSTEAEYMMACAAGRMSLYIRSILFDIGVPQEAATILYEDNDGATAMANAGKPTSRSRHIDIKFYALQEWVERDLVVLKRIDTSLNMSDHFTKSLPPRLFYRHRDFYMGHVPPRYSPCFNNVLRTHSLAADNDRRHTVVARAAHTAAPWDVIISSLMATSVFSVSRMGSRIVGGL